MYDLIIVGSGPAGLAAALSAKRKGLGYLVIERGVIANTLFNYPLARPLFSTSDEVELEAGALRPNSKPTREEVLAHYTGLVAREQLNVHTGERVFGITPMIDSFLVVTDAREYHARTVLVAVGGFGRQRKLNVPGDHSSHISYHFVSAEPYRAKRVLVIGGGNSAAEASLSLAEAGAKVILSVRRPTLDLPEESDQIDRSGYNKPSTPRARIKPWVRGPLECAAVRGAVRIIPSSEVIEIHPRYALLRISKEGVDYIETVECDHIFALIGADPDTGLLEAAGAEIADDGRPVYDSYTYETTVPGLYVAGHITREMHMKNAVETAKRIAYHIASQVLKEPELSFDPRPF